MPKLLHYHNGFDDFPHGAGASLPGFYLYESLEGVLQPEPEGPLSSKRLIEVLKNLTE